MMCILRSCPTLERTTTKVYACKPLVVFNLCGPYICFKGRFTLLLLYVRMDDFVELQLRGSEIVVQLNAQFTKKTLPDKYVSQCTIVIVI